MSMRKRILIVEDDRSFATVLNFLFKGEGYKVDVVHTGASALDQIHKKTPDMVILDVNLPDINGFKLCEAIKARQDTVAIPVIMLTARDRPVDLEKGKALGVAEYLVKPADHRKLLEAARRHLG